MTDTRQQTAENVRSSAQQGDPPSTWITIAQLQQDFGIGRTTAYAWAHQLPSDICMRIGSKKLVINERKLVDYLEQKGTRYALR